MATDPAAPPFAWLEAHRVDLSAPVTPAYLVGNHNRFALGILRGWWRHPDILTKAGLAYPAVVALRGRRGSGRRALVRQVARELRRTRVYEIAVNRVPDESIASLAQFCTPKGERVVFVLTEADGCLERDGIPRAPVRRSRAVVRQVLEGAKAGGYLVVLLVGSHTTLEPRAQSLVENTMLPVGQADPATLAVFFEARARADLLLEGDIDFGTLTAVASERTFGALEFLIVRLGERGRPIDQAALALAMVEGPTAVAVADRPTDELRRTSLHEAAHVAANVVVLGPRSVTSARISRRQSTAAIAGRVSAKHDGLPHDLAPLIAAAAGRVLEDLVFAGGASAGCSTDMAHLRAGCLRAIADGMEDDEVGLGNLWLTPALIDATVDRATAEILHLLTTEIFRAAREIVLLNRAEIERFAARLAAASELAGDALRDSIDEAGFRSPIRLDVPLTVDGPWEPPIFALYTLKLGAELRERIRRIEDELAGKDRVADETPSSGEARGASEEAA